jgi:hypothetical protein
MTRQTKYLRACAEILIAAVAGFTIARASSWYDPDKVLNFGSFLLVIGFGIAFGAFGRCRIWIIACIALWASLLYGV